MGKIDGMLMSGLDWLSRFAIGQSILKLVDRCMWVIEKSVQWSLPDREVTEDENGKTFSRRTELVRPLPWFIFLPVLLCLRLTRMGLDAIGSLLGYPQVEPSQVVRVIQKARRRLRAIKSNGAKIIRQKEPQIMTDRAMTMKEASKSLAKSLRLTLSTLSCLDSGSKTSPSPPPTEIRVSNTLDGVDFPHDQLEQIVRLKKTDKQGAEALTAAKERVRKPGLKVPAGEKKEEDVQGTLADNPSDMKRKYEDLSESSDISDDEADKSDGEPILAKINRLANQTDSDIDYSPDSCDEDSETSNSSRSQSEADLSITPSEVLDLKADQEEMEKKYDCANPACPGSDCDDDLHTLNANLKKCLEKLSADVEPQINGSQEQDESEAPLVEAITTDKLTTSTTNGMSVDRDTAYYSPISWKSVSPEVSITSDKQDNQLDTEGKSEELNNGEVNNEKNGKDYDSNKPCAGDGGEVANGHMKEKQRTSSQSGGNGSSNKHHQKNKRGNHGSRKKK